MHILKYSALPPCHVFVEDANAALPLRSSCPLGMCPLWLQLTTFEFLNFCHSNLFRISNFVLRASTARYQIRYTTYDIRNTRPVLSAVEGYAPPARISKTHNPHRTIAAQEVRRIVQFVSVFVKKCAELFKTCKLLSISVNFYPHFSLTNACSPQHPHLQPQESNISPAKTVFFTQIPNSHKPCLYSSPSARCIRCTGFPPFFGFPEPRTHPLHAVSLSYKPKLTRPMLMRNFKNLQKTPLALSRPCCYNCL
jgi:hypothetical protein